MRFAWNPIENRGELGVFEVVRTAWSGPGRAYHDLEHLAEMLGWCGLVASSVGWAQPREVFFATLFHDAVYEPLSKDNELRSADLARKELGQEPALRDVDSAVVARLIERTAEHGRHPPREVDDDEGLFLDADMAILAADEARYRRYAAGVRQEYAAVPDEAFAAGRRRFVTELLAAPSIYVSPWFRSQLEARARANLMLEKAWLGGT